MVARNPGPRKHRPAEKAPANAIVIVREGGRSNIP
jgi:hypothetical protein